MHKCPRNDRRALGIGHWALGMWHRASASTEPYRHPPFVTHLPNRTLEGQRNDEAELTPARGLWTAKSWLRAMTGWVFTRA